MVTLLSSAVSLVIRIQPVLNTEFFKKVNLTVVGRYCVHCIESLGNAVPAEGLDCAIEPG